MSSLPCFKAYDIRGKLGEELNEDIAWCIGRAYGEFLKPKTIVLGGDVPSAETLKLALAKGLQDAGVDVCWILACPAPKKIDLRHVPSRRGWRHRSYRQP